MSKNKKEHQISIINATMDREKDEIASPVSLTQILGLLQKAICSHLIVSRPLYFSSFVFSLLIVRGRGSAN